MLTKYDRDKGHRVQQPKFCEYNKQDDYTHSNGKAYNNNNNISSYANIK